MGIASTMSQKLDCQVLVADDVVIDRLGIARHPVLVPEHLIFLRFRRNCHASTLWFSQEVRGQEENLLASVEPKRLLVVDDPCSPQRPARLHYLKQDMSTAARL